MTAITTAAAPDPRRARPTRYRAAGPLFVAPFLLLFLLLFLAPLAYAAYLSLFQHRLIGGTTFVGLDNYLTAVKDPVLRRGVLRVATFFVIQVPVMLVLSLLFALALDSGLLRLARVVRLGIFVPYAVPSVVAALMWGYLYGPDYGPFAQLARAVDLPVPRFLSGSWPLGSLANIVTWEFVGYNRLSCTPRYAPYPANCTRRPRWTGRARGGSRGASSYPRFGRRCCLPWCSR